MVLSGKDEFLDNEEYEVEYGDSEHEDENVDRDYDGDDGDDAESEDVEYGDTEDGDGDDLGYGDDLDDGEDDPAYQGGDDEDDDADLGDDGDFAGDDDVAEDAEPVPAPRRKAPAAAAKKAPAKAPAKKAPAKAEKRPAYRADIDEESDESVDDDAAHPIEVLMEALDAALAARAKDLPAADAQGALRLFSGFYEGYPSLTIDLYGSTLVLHDHSSRGNEKTVRAALDRVQKRLPWLRAALWKRRKSANPHARGGQVILGNEALLADRIRENGVWYALDLTHHQDATLYLDTRPLRLWLHQNMRGKTLLNTFAYTGSLGVAALAGGATRALQLDRNSAFLDIARRSSQLNGLVVKRRDLVAADFFEHIGRLKKEKTLFDAIIVDPPFFARNDRSRVDQEAESLRLLNKVRPLIADGGVLIAVNNALYLPGATFQSQLESMTGDHYLTIEARLDIPQDITGYPTTRQSAPPADPAPFNHATKIAILRVRRKDRAKATPPPG